MGRAPGTPAARRDQRDVWLKIMAFTDVPVVRADVRVTLHRSHGRPLVDVRAATNNYGVFPVQVRSHPSSFRVEISGGTTNGDPFLGHLMADVVLTDPAHQIVVINPVTTLVSLVLDQEPNLKLDGAEARVRSFLTIPANYPLGLALRQGSHYTPRFFSPVSFMTEAQDAGGPDAFAHLLLQELASDSTHSFRKPKPLGDTTSTASSDVEAGLEAGVLDYAGANNAANLTGWAMSLAGLSTSASSSEIDALVNALTELQSEVQDLTTEVAQLNQLVQSTATQTQYDQITNLAEATANQVNEVEGNLSYFANACPPVPAGSTPTPPGTFCTNQKQFIISQLDTYETAYVTLEGCVQDNGTLGTEGMLHLYSLWLGESKPFFRAADSTKMQDLYNYWDSVLAQAANLKTELLHENDAQDSDPKQLTDFLGNPDLSPPTTGSFQANEAANVKLMFPPVPAGTVVSTVDHTMWALLPWAPDWLGALTIAASCDGVSYGPVTSGVPDSPTYYGLVWITSNNYTNGHPTAPLKAQWQAAVTLAPPLSSGTNWQQWLTQQTMTTGDETPASDGWFNILSCTNPPLAAWTNDADGADYWIIHTDKDSFTASPTGSKYPNLVWPSRILATGEQYFWYN
jgi:hypothetical protein